MRIALGAGIVLLLLVGGLTAQDGTKKAEPEGAKPDAGKAEEKADETKEPGIQFLNSLDDAKKQAAEAKKKLFIVFGTPT